jgi:hypothetical protein
MAACCVLGALALGWWGWTWIVVGALVLILVVLGIMLYPRDGSF